MTGYFLKTKINKRLLYILFPLLLASYKSGGVENPIFEKIGAAQKRIYFAGKPFQSRVLLTSLSLARYRDLDVLGLFWEDPRPTFSRETFQTEGISLIFPNEKIDGPFSAYVLIDDTMYVAREPFDVKGDKLSNLEPADPKLQALFLTFFYKHYGSYLRQNSRIEISKAEIPAPSSEHSFVVPFRAKGRDKDANVPLKLPKVTTSQRQQSLQP